jgi:zinc and cadmium transporter
MAGRMDGFSPADGLTFPLRTFIISSRIAVHKGRASGPTGVGVMTEALALSAFCTAVVIVSVLGGILPLAVMLNHTRLQVYLSFSAGAMLGAAFFHMMPEAVRVGSPETLYWTAFGLLALFFLERFFSFHHHEAHDSAQPGQAAGAPPALVLPRPRTPRDVVDHDHHEHATAHPAGALRWGPAAVGLAVHSLVGGIALASAVAADYDVGRGAFGAGLGVFVATLVHKPADALTITALMLESGTDRRFAHLVNFAFALMIPAGVVLFWAGTRCVLPISAGTWTAAALAFSAGTFLCIALSDLLPELQFHSHDRVPMSVALLAGFALMAGTALVEPSSARFAG